VGVVVVVLEVVAEQLVEAVVVVRGVYFKPQDML
jgi:hypothetical protein